MISEIGIEFPEGFLGKLGRWEGHWSRCLVVRGRRGIITSLLGDSGGEDLVHFILYSGLAGYHFFFKQDGI